MPECDYCGASFASEREELRHLKSEHRDELGPIDRRRVGDVDVGDDDGLPTGPIALGVVLLASVAIVGYVVFIAGGTGGDAGNTGPHVHGTMEATIDGEEIDLMQSRYTGNDDRFHFHGNERSNYGANVWHIHGNSGVTLQYALRTLGFEVSADGSELTFDGTTYDDGDPDTDVRVLVDGDPVEPGDYVLKGVRDEEAAAQGQGDDVRVVVETE